MKSKTGVFAASTCFVETVGLFCHVIDRMNRQPSSVDTTCEDLSAVILSSQKLIKEDFDQV